MVVPQRFPHSLYILAPEGGEVDENGDIIPGIPQWVNVTECREEKRTGTLKRMNDGTFLSYSAMIFTPPTFEGIDTGATFEVRQGSQVRIKGTVILFDKGTNHCRIWV